MFKGTALQTASVASGYLFSFIIGPVLLARVGLAEFGVWAVTGAVMSYVGLADLGMQRSISRFVALHQARGDDRGLRECVTVGVGIATGLSGLAAGVAIAIAPILQDAVGVVDVDDMRVLLLCAATMLAAGLYGAVLTAVPYGFRRLVPVSAATFAASVVNFAFSLTALLVHPDLVTYALANVAASLVAVAIDLVVMRSVWKHPRLAVPSRTLVREMVAFGLKNQVGRVVDLLNYQTDKVVIAVLIGPSVAGAYELAVRLLAAARAIAILTVWGILPTVTAEIARHGRAVIAGFYRRYTPLSASLTVPLFVLLAVIAPYLLTAWLDELPPNSANVLAVLSIANLVNLTTGVADSITLADGRPGVTARYLALSAILNVGLTVALTPVFGLSGVLAGTFIAIVLPSLLFMRKFHRIYGLPLLDYARAVGPSIGTALAVGAPIAVAAAILGPADERWPATAALLGLSIPYGVVYWLLATRAGQLPSRLAAPWPRRRTAGAPGGPAS
jgi:O-antigen/teichoic acid export membrane protein